MTPPRLLIDGLLRSASVSADKVAIVEQKSECTYAQLLDRAARLAGFLIAQGVQPGDRIAIYLDNGWPCAAAIYGTMMAGGVFVVINPQTKTEKLNFLLADCGATALITDQHLERQCGPAVGGLEQLRLLISFGATQSANALPQVSDLVDVMQSAPRPDNPVRRDADDLAALIYTSGSTGEPKGVMQTHDANEGLAAFLERRKPAWKHK